MDQELLGALEERWNALAETVRTLKSENHALKERVREREEQLARVGDVTAKLKQKVEGLQQDRNQTMGRIEGLLSRFEDHD
ncbi:cell division protein ZapB [Magnetococcus sp. PR-3]|uniref:cell division protein ZapB n=1 Tax=Magnetococcus sp. PR-3 TaxID=3120355 RepID=UPI002FCE5FCD